MQPYAGSISSTYIDMFSSIASKHPVDDYVFLRSDANTYCLYVGDLDLDDAVFTGDCVCYKLVYDNTYQSSYYTLSETAASCNVDASDGIVYSNLGYYPTLDGGDHMYDFAILVLQVVCCCVCLCNGVFGAVRR